MAQIHTVIDIALNYAPVVSIVGVVVGLISFFLYYPWPKVITGVTISLTLLIGAMILLDANIDHTSPKLGWDEKTIVTLIALVVGLIPGIIISALQVSSL
eukprot:TRINITY_DN2389_c0_g2_i2.p1 TRINITY_DN2389_c0_g2~~TRINITY_DN2389_c0_g2_i2.p1  ORF type:complete len:100 (+),score=5.29 TRINITY_DN2389_c0_g2_i2:51-350(+)